MEEPVSACCSAPIMGNDGCATDGCNAEHHCSACFNPCDLPDTPAVTPTDSLSGEQASEGREVAVSDAGALEGQETPNSHLATEGDLDAFAPGEWHLSCPKCRYTVEKMTATRPLCPKCGTRLSIISEPLQPEISPMGDEIAGGPCEKCQNPAEVILLIAGFPSRCFNCCLIAAMKRPCSICGQHITEAITRALDEQGKPNTIGTCLQCLMKAAAAQRN